MRSLFFFLAIDRIRTSRSASAIPHLHEFGDDRLCYTDCALPIQQETEVPVMTSRAAAAQSTRHVAIEATTGRDGRRFRGGSVTAMKGSKPVRMADCSLDLQALGIKRTNPRFVFRTDRLHLRDQGHQCRRHANLMSYYPESWSRRVF